MSNETYQIVTRDYLGRYTVVADLHDGVNTVVKDGGVTMNPPQIDPLTSNSVDQEGADWIGAHVNNGQITFSMYVIGSTADDLANRISTLVQYPYARDNTYYLKIQLFGATYPIYAEIVPAGNHSVSPAWREWAAFRSSVELDFAVKPFFLLDGLNTYDFFDTNTLTDYTTVVGAGSLTYDSANNRVNASSATPDYRLFHTAKSYQYSDVVVTSKFHTSTNVTGQAMAVGARMTLSGGVPNTWIEAHWTSGTLAIRMTTNGGSSFTTLASVSATAPSTDTDYWMRLIVDGNIIRAEKWTTQPTWLGGADNTVAYDILGSEGIPDSGYAGISRWNLGGATTSAYIDELFIEAFVAYNHHNRNNVPLQKLLRDVPGDVDALCDLVIDYNDNSGSPSVPKWGMFAWQQSISEGKRAFTVPAWKPSAPQIVNRYLQPGKGISILKGRGRVFKVTGAGTSTATVPRWAPNIGITSITNASPGVITTPSAHGLSAGDEVYFTTTGALPTGLSPGVHYYVSGTGLTSTTFSVAATQGGTRINTSSAGSGTHTLWYVRDLATGETVTQDGVTYKESSLQMVQLDVARDFTSSTLSVQTTASAYSNTGGYLGRNLSSASMSDQAHLDYDPSQVPPGWYMCFARMRVGNAINNPYVRLQVSQPNGYGQDFYTAEYGQLGKQATVYGSAVWRWEFLGTIYLGADVQNAQHRLILTLTADSGSSGDWGVDVMTFVPQQSMAAKRWDVDDTTPPYVNFGSVSSSAEVIINNKLAAFAQGNSSGAAAWPNRSGFPNGSMVGSQIKIPTGDVYVFGMLTQVAPGATQTTANDIGDYSVTWRPIITPRSRFQRGS